MFKIEFWVGTYNGEKMWIDSTSYVSHYPTYEAALAAFSNPPVGAAKRDSYRIVAVESKPVSSLSPSYYSSLNPEPIDVIRKWALSFNRGCAVKYIARAGKKDPTKEVEDLEKAITYLQHEVKFLKGCIK